MKPFNIGDKVRIVDRIHGHEEKIGTGVWRIRTINTDRHKFNYGLYGSVWLFEDDELELVYNFRDYEKAVNSITT